MKSYQPYETVNRELYRGNALFMEKTGATLRFSDIPTPKSRCVRPARIGIYAGTGTSHSWLWFVDLFEKTGFWNLFCLNETDIIHQGLDDLDVLVISGGDTFAVAEGLGQKGSGHILAFIRRGGVYIGSCAGAYLPMKSSKPPLDLFNFVDVKITNLSKILPPSIRTSPKFCTSYGCDFIFHPVREEVRLKIDSGNHSRTISAPMYGGPGMRVTDPSTVLATYAGFTDKTTFLVHPDLAFDILMNQAAIVRTSIGKGCLYLFGPHMEHPGYPEANRWVADVLFWETGCPDRFSLPAAEMVSADRACHILSGSRAAALLRGLRRELSNSRIAASAMEFCPVSWLIGKKTYEPEKARVFLEAMWKRLPRLEKEHRIILREGAETSLIQDASEITELLRGIRSGIKSGKDTLEMAIRMFDCLHSLSTSFLDAYFQTALSIFRRSDRHQTFVPSIEPPAPATIPIGSDPQDAVVTAPFHTTGDNIANRISEKPITA